MDGAEICVGEPAVGEGLTPFSVYELRPNDLPYLGEVSIPLASEFRGPMTPLEVLLCCQEARP
jgi:hypothetical protein